MLNLVEIAPVIHVQPGTFFVTRYICTEILTTKFVVSIHFPVILTVRKTDNAANALNYFIRTFPILVLLTPEERYLSYYHKCTLNTCSRSRDILTRQLEGEPGVRFPAQTRDISLLENIKTGSAAHPASSVCTGIHSR